VIDLFLALCAGYFLGFVVPVFGDMFEGLGASSLPVPTKVLLHISKFCMAAHGAPLILILALLLSGIVAIYWLLHRRGRGSLFGYLWLVLLSLFLIVGLMFVSVFLPIFRIDGIVTGPGEQSAQPADRRR
jgi:type II secretory pathway component PulF